MDEKDSTVAPETAQRTEVASPPHQPRAEIQAAPPPDYSAPKAKTEQLEDARGWESENLIQDLEKELEKANYKKGFFDLEFKNPKHFTWLLVLFASMGGLLSGLDQSLISGANLKLPHDLGLTDRQNSLVNSGMPLGAIGGAILISPCNEYFGRRWAILISCILYTIGGALEAGSISFGMMVAARVILGAGVGLEGGTVPVYVAETVESRLRGNLVSLYQFNIALGEVLGYAVAAMFIKVDGSWRYILGSSLLFSTIMGIGMLFMPESPRYLMHKGKPLEAFKVWLRIRGIATHEAREEFFVMKVSTEMEEAEVAAGRTNRFPWMDFFTKPRARRAIIYANIMIFLGQFTGVNALLYYMSVLMSQVGFNTYDATYMSLVGGGALMIGTIPAIFLMETCGRRFWAIAMLPGFFIGLVLVGVSYQIKSFEGTLGVYLTGLILYELFFGSYAALTWVIPSEVYPTYLRSYGMGTSTGWLFLSSFIITYNFTGMQQAFTRTGLSLGFFGGIAVLGWFYQIFFMPETKDKTLEEIDQLFQMPTSQLVKQNAKNSWEVTKDLAHLRFRKVFIENNQTRFE
ncbi:MFS sugar transporter-like protein [Cucurbitaria berberidis CBS 394.84]|uniref:MFS sugar transporter-like protein n=1 Tax=Cucurbitaria berberidis CBS 394.84 TaxID=1168544 RepID=A0A9P4LF99_9PLEO|nr:MFS sugar transporter-like protein [Cucurbitaria berberidis CBS 394.84]KAF1851854.1 MFS sugar transporter-like protein [Cucurbitaria berberidis CBS 394.84]